MNAEQFSVSEPTGFEVLAKSSQAPALTSAGSPAANGPFCLATARRSARFTQAWTLRRSPSP